MSENISTEFSFKLNLIEVDGSNIHYVGEESGDPILFFHGNPTSSYLRPDIIP